MRLRIILLLILILSSYVYCIFMRDISFEELQGTYVNCNVGHKVMIPEYTYKRDTLVIYESKKFKSKYLGEGNIKLMKISESLSINLITSNRIGYGFTFKRNLLGTPKLCFAPYKGHYYVRISN